MDEAIQIVLDYLNETLFEPGADWPDRIFTERSYSRWAATEIIGILMDHPFDEPEILIEEFMLNMTCYSYQCEHKKQRFMFTTASKTAKDILKLLIKRRRT